MKKIGFHPFAMQPVPVCFVFFIFLLMNCTRTSREFVEIPVSQIEDKIRGGLIGQLLGNLNGLPHEFQYINEPGEVENYTPDLSEGARTDDDTDIEWVYLVEMQKNRTIFIPPDKISELWRTYINHNIWCANKYARGLMELGIEPPLTGNLALNPWSVFNISGQFVCESFGLIAPAMPKTASAIGLHYTHVTIDGEPAQTTQLFTSMISTAFIESDVVKILAAGLAAVDRKSEIFRIVTDVYRLWKTYPADWRKTRQIIKQRYTRYNGSLRDRNGYELNTAATIASLLYGYGDFTETLRCAFNFGWDADNNAATCGTIVGVIQGHRWISAQKWNIKDVYQNVSRDGMPDDETITGFGDRLIDAAERVILKQGGKVMVKDSIKVFQIPVEKPENVESLFDSIKRREDLRNRILPGLENGLAGSPKERARTAYLGIALGEAERLRRIQPIAWQQAVEMLQKFPDVINNIFTAPKPFSSGLQERAKAEGLQPLK